jgi:hypothetical protein
LGRAFWIVRPPIAGQFYDQCADDDVIFESELLQLLSNGVPGEELSRVRILDYIGSELVLCGLDWLGLDIIETCRVHLLL